MAIKEWIVTAQVNIEANRHASVTVKANTERKARIKAEEEFKKLDYFFVSNLVIKLKDK